MLSFAELSWKLRACDAVKSRTDIAECCVCYICRYVHQYALVFSMRLCPVSISADCRLMHYVISVESLSSSLGACRRIHCPDVSGAVIVSRTSIELCSAFGFAL